MKNLSTFNKIFLIFCAVLIAFLALTVPHEVKDASDQEESSYVSSE